MINHELLKVKRGSITIAYHETKNYISFSDKALELLGNPKYISVRLTDEHLIISASEKGYVIETTENKKLIKCALLIKKIIEQFSLDLGKKYRLTSNINIVEGEEKTIAVKIK